MFTFARVSISSPLILASLVTWLSSLCKAQNLLNHTGFFNILFRQFYSGGTFEFCADQFCDSDYHLKQLKLFCISNFNRDGL